MMISILRKIIFGKFLIYLALTSNLNNFSHGEKTRNELIRESGLTIRAIDKALIYFRNNPKTLLDDVKLSVLMTRSNLQWISDRLRSHFGNGHAIKKKLTETMRMCESILEMNQEQNSLLLNKTMWEKGAEDIVYGRLRPTDDFLLPNLDSCQSIEDYVMKGSPNQSDSCINELIASDCNVSDYCWLSETNGDLHSGYKTSHRLMYLQAADKLECDKKNFNNYFYHLRERREKLCQRMLSEARAIFDRTRFLTMRDLFLEQIALCGLEGHKEFGPENWREEVRGWQNDNGCFGEKNSYFHCYPNASKVKRTDSVVVDDCHTHVTAVATAAMAFHLRLILNSVFLFLPNNSQP